MTDAPKKRGRPPKKLSEAQVSALDHDKNGKAGGSMPKQPKPLSESLEERENLERGIKDRGVIQEPIKRSGPNEDPALPEPPAEEETYPGKPEKGDKTPAQIEIEGLPEQDRKGFIQGDRKYAPPTSHEDAPAPRIDPDKVIEPGEESTPEQIDNAAHNSPYVDPEVSKAAAVDRVGLLEPGLDADGQNDQTQADRLALDSDEGKKKRAKIKLGDHEMSGLSAEAFEAYDMQSERVRFDSAGRRWWFTPEKQGDRSVLFLQVKRLDQVHEDTISTSFLGSEKGRDAVAQTVARMSEAVA